MLYTHMQIHDRDGCLARIEPVARDVAPRWARDVAQAPRPSWPAPAAPETPFFGEMRPFVIPPADGDGEPFYPHNHCPALTWCDNGDLFAAWFSTEREQGTEMTILASRLRAGATAWEPAAEFFKAPDRNMTGTALLNDGAGTLHHFNGVGPAGVTGWENLLLLRRRSTDNGATWSVPAPVSSGAQYRRRHQVIAGTSITPDGRWLQACDGTPGGEGPSAVHVSCDGGESWHDPGGDIRGIHAGVVGLTDGRLLAFGRAQAFEGQMPLSLSEDGGATWQVRPSPFPPIGTAQRLVLLRLREGPLLLVSFTGPTHHVPRAEWPRLDFTDAAGRSCSGCGLYTALSFDEGETWPARRLLTPGQGSYNGGGWTQDFTATPTEAEPAGYLAATQTPDNVVHLISSRLHYRFNLAWLRG